jgi:hypothetical protein
MTRKEQEKIANIIWGTDMNYYADAMLKAEEILALFEGYKSPEQCQAEFTIGFEAWGKEEWDKRKKEGWKSPGEVDALAMDSVIASLQRRIEWIGEELDRMQSEYRKLTGKDHVYWK